MTLYSYDPILVGYDFCIEEFHKDIHGLTLVFPSRVLKGELSNDSSRLVSISHIAKVGGLRVLIG